MRQAYIISDGTYYTSRTYAGYRALETLQKLHREYDGRISARNAHIIYPDNEPLDRHHLEAARRAYGDTFRAIPYDCCLNSVIRENR